MILADDLGYGDLGCYGQRQIRTPHIDRLASEGVRFTQAYSGATVCAPSRCCLMTGFHTGHSRTRGNMYPDLPLRPQDTTIAELLKGAGYRTGLFGKWALGQLGSTGFPTRKGFDEYFGFFGQSHAHNYYPEHLLDNETPHILRENMGSRKIYAPDVIQDRALKFITKSDDRPLFAHLTYTLPHANNELGTASGNGMEVAPGTRTYAGRDWPQVERDMAAMVTQLDLYVGQVIAALPKVRETLVIFSSDNGPHAEGGHSPKFFESSGALRGIKRDLYEGGIRVPMIGWWPGRIAPRVSDQTWAHWDVLPTLCEVAGVATPRGIDGISMWPSFTGGEQRARHEYLYWEFHERRFAQAVRLGDWKGVRTNVGQPAELYDLKADVSERTNVAAANPDVVRRMEALMAEARIESEYWPVKR